MWKCSAVGIFILTERSLDTIVAKWHGDPVLLMVQISACISQSGDFSLNLKAAQLPDYRKAVIQFELSSVGRNMQRLCLTCLSFQMTLRCKPTKTLLSLLCPRRHNKSLQLPAVDCEFMPLVNRILFVNGTNGSILLHCFTS